MIVPPAPLLTNRLLLNDWTVPFTPVPLNDTFEFESCSVAPARRRASRSCCRSGSLLSAVASVFACCDIEAERAPRKHRIADHGLGAAIRPSIAAVAELCTRTFESVASILLPPAAMLDARIRPCA